MAYKKDKKAKGTKMPKVVNKATMHRYSGKKDIKKVMNNK